MGFLLLSVGIGAGAGGQRRQVHGADLGARSSNRRCRSLAWMVFATLCSSADRLKLGFRGRKSAYLTIAGVMLGLMTVAGMTL